MSACEGACIGAIVDCRARVGCGAVVGCGATVGCGAVVGCGALGSTIAEQLAKDYNAPLAEIQGDILQMVQDLADKGVLRV